METDRVIRKREGDGEFLLEVIDSCSIAERIEEVNADAGASLDNFKN